MLFMLAGYETTSTTLAYSTFVLATRPEEQQKLYDEIISMFDVETGVDWINIKINQILKLILISSFKLKPDADNVNELKYLDMFIKEVLRMYPIGNP